MPTAGDEGYERLVPCPYDKAHEIRKGRMQFHLEKCRRNFPMSQLVDCPYNKGHLVPKQELQYHMDEECESRATWDRFTHEVTVDCPVKDLVPVNAATVPDGDENWDNFEAAGSVLNHIKTEAENKPIVRICQVASKATRKAFRMQERRRYEEVSAQKPEQVESAVSDTSSIISNKNHPLPKPRRQPNVPVVKQDPSKAVAAINKQFRTLDLNIKSSTGNVAPSETSSMINGPPSEYETASTSRQMPFSYAAASQSAGRPSSAMSNSSAGTSSTSMMTALTSQRAGNINLSRPSTAMSDSTFKSFTSASQGGATNRPPSAMSNSSAGTASSIHHTTTGMSDLSFNSFATATQWGATNRPPSAMSNSSVGTVSSIHRPPNSSGCRPSTAMTIAASVASYNRAPPVDEDGFCQIPIPGLGRGRRRPNQ